MSDGTRGVVEPRLRQRQRAGLVEHDGVDGRQPLDGVAGIDDDPARNSAPDATTCTAGIASASAQGQVMMRTAMPVTIASCNEAPAISHPSTVSAAVRCTTGA